MMIFIVFVLKTSQTIAVGGYDVSSGMTYRSFPGLQVLDR